ncbi:MAG: hypothetical protein AAGA44_01910 [Pseudomonadota bacterium]
MSATIDNNSEMTLDDASLQASAYFAQVDACLHDRRVDCEHGWVFFGHKRWRESDGMLKPGSTPWVCLAINRFNQRMYSVCPPYWMWLQCPHEEELRHFTVYGRLGFSVNSGRKWLRVFLDSPVEGRDIGRIADLLSTTTTMDFDSSESMLRHLFERGGTSDFIRCLSEQHEEACVYGLWDLLPEARLRHSLMGRMVDPRTLAGEPRPSRIR